MQEKHGMYTKSMIRAFCQSEWGYSGYVISDREENGHVVGKRGPAKENERWRESDDHRQLR